jgi:hypothetical protein
MKIAASLMTAAWVVLAIYLMDDVVPSMACLICSQVWAIGTMLLTARGER